MGRCKKTWQERLIEAADRIDAGRPEQVTCLLPMIVVCHLQPQRAIDFLHHLLRETHREAASDPDSHPAAAERLAEVLAFARADVRPVVRAERLEAQQLSRAIYALQPGYKSA